MKLYILLEFSCGKDGFLGFRFREVSWSLKISFAEAGFLEFSSIKVSPLEISKFSSREMLLLGI
jgi:hypothetical protein